MNVYLYVKVAKERLESFKLEEVDEPSSDDLRDLDFLHYLMKKREQNLFMELGMKMMSAGRENMFDTWMYQESDLIQYAARSYGELIMSSQFLAALESCDASLKPVLTRLYQQFVLGVVEGRLGWFITSDLLSADQARQVPVISAQLCRELSDDALALTAAFGLPEAMVPAPVARDWVQYNTYDNQGEL